MKPVVFLNSHPIQYFAPLYQQMASKGSIALEVFYCSDESVKGELDKGFGTAVKWDIPLLSGYNAFFLRNYSFKPSIHKGFLGLFNPGIIPVLFKKKRSIVIVHGWAYVTNILTIISAKLMGHHLCIRAETPLNQENQKNKIITILKHRYLRLIFLFADHFLYIGQQNKMFYKALGIPDSKLVFTPYCVDNARFRNVFKSTTKPECRSMFDIPKNQKVILFSGKYIEKKRPLEILKAFALLRDKQTFLVMVGEGDLRPAMELFIKENNLKTRVKLTGFINQMQISYYYRLADIFVMCSGLGETWGLSVNEAMNFGLPVIVSSTCGCASDLVKDGLNGKVYETGNIDELKNSIEFFLTKNEAELKLVTEQSFKILDEFCYETIINNIETIQL